MLLSESVAAAFSPSLDTRRDLSTNILTTLPEETFLGLTFLREL